MLGGVSARLPRNVMAYVLVAGLVFASAATAASSNTSLTVAVPGTASVLHRIKAKLYQVMLDRHPLYTYAGDSNGSAKGQGINSYGGSWHVVAAVIATTTGS